MNPLIVLILVFVLKETNRNRPYIWSGPLYFDTFRMELMLDRLRTLTEMLEKVNRLSQVNQMTDVLEILDGFEGPASLLSAAGPLIQGFLGEENEKM